MIICIMIDLLNFVKSIPVFESDLESEKRSSCPHRQKACPFHDPVHLGIENGNWECVRDNNPAKD